MRKQEIKEAFSQLHASEKMVLEVLTMKTEKKYVSFSRKMAKVVMVAALAIVIVATAAFAAPAIYDALVNGRIHTDGEIGVTPTGAEDQPATPWFDIRVDVDMNEDAPTSIEKFYMLNLHEGYEQYHGFVYKDKMLAIYMWTNGEENWEDEVRLYQYAGGTYDPQKSYWSVKAAPGETPETKLVQLGGIQGYLVEDVFSYGIRHFFWSDGENLFHLQVPDEYTDEDITQVLQGIVLVEDILPYCIDMEEEHIKDVFG